MIDIKEYEKLIQKELGEDYFLQWEENYPGGFIEVYNQEGKDVRKRLFSIGTKDFQSIDDCPKLIDCIKSIEG